MPSKWTSDQQKAIFAENGTLLVSAAAGSGKTSVLVQRVINRITNSVCPIDLDKFLIVTFTNAAAQEMKDRISESLAQLSASNPKDLNIYRQQMLLKCTSIGTIHSFCNGLIKEYFYKLDISPNFRIAQESELIHLKEKAIERTFEYFYNFRHLDLVAVMDLFNSEKNIDKLTDIINSINDFANSIPFPEKWFDEKLNLYKSYDDNKKLNPWMKTILDYSKDALEFCIFLMKDAINAINHSECIKKAYLTSFETDVYELESVLSCLCLDSWDVISQKIKQFKFSRLKLCKTKEEEETLKANVNSKRDYVKEVFSKLKSYFVFSQKEFSESLEKISKITKILFEITIHFRKEIFSLKLSKNILDFNDLEHLALKLLIDENNGEDFKKSDIANEVSQRYYEVMVDEYQDINEVQDIIFKLITKNESNLFMVGDVKQSIYKFRQSRPKIFLNKKNKYPLYDKDSNSYPAKIILSKNFRSTSKIIDSINLIFESLMSEKAGEIEYTSEEKLSCGILLPTPTESDVDLELIVEEKNGDIIEAKEIAKRILEMISKGYKINDKGKIRPVNYSDFCILLRSANAHAHVYTHELSKKGIPCWSETNQKFLDTSEIVTILSLLKVIDNPINDIPLISCMTSPLFGFSIDKLSAIRQTQNEKSFYFVLKSYVEDNSQELEICNFLKVIEHYRNISGTMSCSELIDYLYLKTDYPYICLALPDGEIKKSNLFLFRSYAKKFDDEHSKGLKGFLNFIEGIIRKNSDLPSASAISNDENAVKIMSVHKSKGLEFPVCILAGCSRHFVQDSESVIIHPELGLGLKLKNSEGTLQFNNLVFKSINLKNRLENISEELRVLYVALTRAKQKLIILSSLDNTEKIAKKLSLIQNLDSIPAFLVQNSGSFLEWIILCLCLSPMRNKIFKALNLPHDGKFLNRYEKLNWNINLVYSKSSEETHNSEIIEHEDIPNKIDIELLKKIKKNIEYKYPFENLSSLPLKIAASKLSESGQWKEYFASSKPAFLSSFNTSAVAKGNAMHKFMCFANFKSASVNLEFELNKLHERKLLTAEEIDLIDKISIVEFLNSSICQRILKSPKILREHRFSVNIPVKKTPLYNEINHKDYPEKLILVQGALDCAFMEDNQYVIVDYKTDKTNNIVELFNKYSSQLKIYKYALEKIYCIKVKEIGIYSFFLSDYYFLT